MVTKKSKGQFKNVPFGNGCVNFEGILKELVRLNYNGSYTIEMWAKNEQNARERIDSILQAKKYFDNIFLKVGIQQENTIV